MEFFDTTTKNGLCQDADFYAGSDTDSYPLADKARRANQWVKQVGIWIWQSVSDWQFDDSNYTTLPRGERDLEDGVEDYDLPTNIFKLERVEVKDIDGNWSKLQPFDESQVTGSYAELYETKGVPLAYDMLGNSLILKPAPDLTLVTEASGLRIHISRDTDDFVAGDTDKKPGFEEMFHQIVSIGMSLDYAVRVMNADKVTSLKRMLYGDPTVKKDDRGLKGDVQDFYARRHDRGFKVKIRPKHRSSI